MTRYVRSDLDPGYAGHDELGSYSSFGLSYIFGTVSEDSRRSATRSKLVSSSKALCHELTGIGIDG